MNFANSNYRTILKKGSGITKLTINGVDYFPTEDGELLLPSNFATTDQLFSGNYNDLINKPTIPAAQVPSDWAATEGVARILNKPALFSGDYNDLSSKPTIPAAQVNSDWNATTGVAQILNKPDLSPLATAIQSAINIGTATGIYVDKQTTSLRFRTIRAGDNVTISVNAAGEIVIAAAGSSGPAGESNTASSLGTGISLVAPKNGVDLPFRSLLSSAGLTWSQQTGTVTITLDTLLQNYVTNLGYGLGGRTLASLNDLTYSGLGRIAALNTAGAPTPGVGGAIGFPHAEGMASLGGQLYLNYSLDNGGYLAYPRLYARSKSSAGTFGNWAEFYGTHNQLNLGTTAASAQAAIDIDQKAFPFTNIMTDSGRFNGLVSPQGLRTSPSFEYNSMFAPYNGGVWSDAGEFIYDNNNNGGASGTMTADVVSLMEALGRSTDRYGIEFHVGNLRQGTGTQLPITATNGATCYLSTVNNSQAIYAADSWNTYVFWARAKTGTLTFRSNFYKNGISQPSGTAIVPTDGWVHIRVIGQNRLGYSNAQPGMQASVGADIQIALPAVFTGKVDVGFHKSPIPGSPGITALLGVLPTLTFKDSTTIEGSVNGLAITNGANGTVQIGNRNTSYTHYSSSTNNHYFYGNVWVQSSLTLLADAFLYGKIYPTSTSYRQAGMYGVYDSYKIGHVWSMGTGYVIPSDGSTFGNLYGLAYKHTNNTTGGTMAGGHQILVVQKGTAGVALGMGGNIWCSGTVSAVSDIRVKTDIQVIPNAVAKVKKLRGVTYERTDKEGPRETGVIAQEVLEVLPEAVTGDEEKYSVSYGNMVGLLIEAIKEQQLQIEELKEQLNGLTK